MPSIPKLTFDVEQARIGLAGGFGALGAAASAQGADLWGVSTFAAASTGTAISGLSGAAATNATLAWLGGGTLAAGGGGMAAGAVVLNMIMFAPGVLIAGLTVGVLGAVAICDECKTEFDVSDARDQFNDEFEGDFDYDERDGGRPTVCQLCRLPHQF
jgi:hypothetical protein